MKKFVLSAVALAVFAAPSLAFAEGVAYWDPPARASSGDVVSAEPAANAAAQTDAAKADAQAYGTLVSFFDPPANDGSGEVGGSQPLIGTHDASSKTGQID